MKKYIAECIGTLALATIVGLSVAGSYPVITPILAACVLGIFVYTIGSISGTHINPAVTIGLWSIGKISSREALAYILAQLLAGALALLLVMEFYPFALKSAASLSPQVWIGEVVGTALFTFGIAAVVLGKVSDTMSGLVVGGSLFLGITLAALMGSLGILNPAVAIGLGVLSPAYFIAPLIGSYIGFQGYRRLLA